MALTTRLAFGASSNRPPPPQLTGAPAGFQAIQLGLDDIEVTGLVPTASYQKAPPRADTTIHEGSNMASSRASSRAPAPSAAGPKKTQKTTPALVSGSTPRRRRTEPRDTREEMD